MKKIFLFCLLALLTTLLFVSCNNDVEGVFYASFVEDGNDGSDASRGLAIRNSVNHPVDKLYWAYTAVKKDGLGAVGQSVKEGTATDDGSNGKTAYGYKLSPVKYGYEAGLDGKIGAFSYGEWEFRVFGFNAYDATNKKYTGLIYTSTAGVSTKIDPASSGEVQIGISLAGYSTYANEKGKLALGGISLKVPKYDVVFCQGDTVTMTISGTVGSTKTVLKTVTTKLVSNIGSGGIIPFDFGGFSKEYDDGTVVKLTVDVYSTDVSGSKYITTVSSGDMSLRISKGNTTTVFGDISNIEFKVATRPIGGQVFYIHPSNNSDASTELIVGNSDGVINIGGYKYQFFDKNDKVKNLEGGQYQRNSDKTLKTDTLTDRLCDTDRYRILSVAMEDEQNLPDTPVRDRFFVVDTKNMFVGAISYGAKGVDVSAMGIPSRKDGIGMGKKITQAVFATKGVTGGAYDVLVNDKFNSGNNGRALRNAKSSIWGYVDFLNNNTTYPTNVGWRVSPAKTTAPGGCKDWYIPTPEEYFMLLCWCGGGMVSAGGATHSNWSQYGNLVYGTNTPGLGIKNTIVNASNVRLNLEMNPHASVFVISVAMVGKNNERCVFTDDVATAECKDGSYVIKVGEGFREYTNCNSIAIRSF